MGQGCGEGRGGGRDPQPVPLRAAVPRACGAPSPATGGSGDTEGLRASFGKV